MLEWRATVTKLPTFYYEMYSRQSIHILFAHYFIVLGGIGGAIVGSAARAFDVLTVTSSM